MRLDKYLADMGLGTRKEVKALIKAKRVKLNGNIILKADINVSDSDEVEFDDQIINYIEYEYILLNKPAGYVCANEDKHYPTVFELIDSTRKDLFTVGRLDKDTEGLLLITNDGTLAHRLLSPKYHVDKLYFAKLDTPLPSNAKEILEKPMDLGDFITKGANFTQLSKDSANLLIHEGKFHQVKRMFEKVGCNVIYLRRDKFAFLNLDELEVSNYRHLTSQELGELKSLVNL